MTPGKETSEFQFAKWVGIFAVIVFSAETVLTIVRDAGYEYPWMSGAVKLVALISAALVSFGYSKGRSLLKATAAANSVADPVPGEKPATPS